MSANVKVVLAKSRERALEIIDKKQAMCAIDLTGWRYALTPYGAGIKSYRLQMRNAKFLSENANIVETFKVSTKIIKIKSWHVSRFVVIQF